MCVLVEESWPFLSALLYFEPVLGRSARSVACSFPQSFGLRGRGGPGGVAKVFGVISVEISVMLPKTALVPNCRPTVP